ncbi:hypothetical protein AC97_2469 [Escherichia coli 2-177-06_S4_C2]|nr:hypothetical protein AC97_2469 [Escherichia coli 2-177-06_S4_C2]
MNSRLVTFVIFARSGSVQSGDARGDKKFFQVLLFTLFTSGFLLIIS